MRKLVSLIFGALALITLTVGGLPGQVRASSHREAPLIAYDPQADNTDVYAFVSPDRPDTVTLVANYIPLEEPNGGPNFNQFGEDVLYKIVVVNDVTAGREISYEFRFQTVIRNTKTFVYNTNPIDSLDDPDWNMPQFYSVTRVDVARRNAKEIRTVLAKHLPTPPVNVGPRSTPNYPALAAAAVRTLPGGTKVFAGQRDDAFYVDLGSVFDLVGLRPVNPLHTYPLPAELGVDGVGGFNTHTIALQIPITSLTRDGSRPTSSSDPRAVIGVYAAAERQTMRVLSANGQVHNQGQFVQVSRLGNPLTNEVVIPVGKKDFWNSQDPLDDRQFAGLHLNPEPTRLANRLYPILSDSPETGRTDIVSIFQTGVRGLNYTGTRQADLLRLNVAIPPNPVPDRLSVLNGDMQGFPNGRRLIDDTVDIEIRAFIEGYGAFAPVIGRPNRVPNNTVGDGVDQNDLPFLTSFPYLATPHQGYEHTHHLRSTTKPVGAN